MADRSNHRIERATFKLTVEKRLHGRVNLPEIVRNELLPVIESIFDDVARSSPPGRAIERLTVDLGTIVHNGSWKPLRSRLAASLRESIKQHEGVASTRQSDASPHQGDRNFPDISISRDDRPSRTSVEDVRSKILDRMNHLRLNADSEDQRRCLDALISALEGLELDEFVDAVIEKADALQRLRPKLRATMLPANRLAGAFGAAELLRFVAVWMRMMTRDEQPDVFLQALDDHVSASPYPAGFLAGIIEQALTDSAIDLEAAAGVSKRDAATLMGSSTAASEARALAHPDQLQGEPHSIQTTETAPPMTSVEDERSKIVDGMNHLRLNADSEDLRRCLDALISALEGIEPDEFVDAVIEKADALQWLKPRLRATILPANRLAGAFGAAELLRFVAVWMRMSKRDEQPDVFLQALDDHVSASPYPASFLAGIIEQALSDSAIDLEAAAGVSKRDAATLMGSSTAASEAHALAHADHIVTDGKLAGTEAELVEYQLFENVLSGARSLARRATKDRLNSEISTLFLNHPWLSRRLVRELGEFGQHGGLVGSELDADELQTLIKEAARIKMPSSKEPAEALERHGAESANRQYFLALALTRLVTDKSLDLEELAIEARSCKPDHSDGNHSVEAYLQSLPEGHRPQAGRVERLSQALERLISRQPDRVLEFFRYTQPDQAFLRRLATLLPEDVLVRLALLLHKAGKSGSTDQALTSLLQLTGTIIDAGYDAGEPVNFATLNITRWQVILQSILNQEEAVDEKALAFALTSELAKAAHIEPAAYRRHVRQRLSEGGMSGLSINAWQRHQAMNNRIRTILGITAPSPQASGGTRHDGVTIQHAGLVLLAPYLPQLFDSLGLTTERSFVSDDAARRGVAILFYATAGHSRTAGDYSLLIKLLCGIEATLEELPLITLQEAEERCIEDLLDAVIGHWAVIGNTSIMGLREAFLQRPGELRRHEDYWRIEVEERSYDMLLDRLPWSFKLIRLPWMEQALHVRWR